MNLGEIGLSFVEGLALIASPCILPVLPPPLNLSRIGISSGEKRRGDGYGSGGRTG